MLKKLVAQEQDDWLEVEENIDFWLEADGKKLTVSDRRILITQWVGKASDKLNGEDYEMFRRRCFEKTGCLLTADGSEDHLVQPEGLKDFKVKAPLPWDGPEIHAIIETPEPEPAPLDAIIEDELFTSETQEIAIESSFDKEEVDVEREDLEKDRLFDYDLVGKKIKGEYVTGWFIGEIMYFNTKLQEYLVTFDDKSEDYIAKEDIDGIQIILIQEDTSAFGRKRNKVDYRKLADA